MMGRTVVAIKRAERAKTSGGEGALLDSLQMPAQAGAEIDPLAARMCRGWRALRLTPISE